MRLREGEATWLLTVLLTSKILFAGIGRFVAVSGTAGWLQSIWCVFVALVIFRVLCRLYRPFEGKDMMAVAELGMGVGARVLVGVLVSGALMLHTALMLRIYADTVSALTLFESPLFFVLLFFAATMMAGAFAGLGGLARICMVAGVVLGGMLALLLFLSVPRFTIENLFPILGKGVPAVLGGLDGLEIFSDVALLFLITPHLNRDGAYRRVGTRALVWSGVTVTAFVLVYLLCVPYPAATQFKLPMLEIAGGVNADVVFQRAEGIFLLVWIFAGFLSLCITFYLSLYSFSRAAFLSDRRGVTAAFLVIAVALALIPGADGSYARYYQVFFLGYTVFAFGLPAVLAVGARLCAGKGAQE